MVVWRADLEDADQKTCADIVSRVPPRAEEAVAIPIWNVRKWLARDTEASIELTDLEGATEPTKEAQEQMRPVVLWRGAESDTIQVLRELRPGMTIVVPCSYGGCDRWGWDPAYEGMVAGWAAIPQEGAHD